MTVRTYNEPIANMTMSAILFLKLKFKSFNAKIGRTIRTKSSNIFTPAAEYMTACALIHFAEIAKSQDAWMGMHCKETANIKATKWQAIHPSETFIAREIRPWLKMRR